MATRNIVPRADNEGGLGTSVKRWKEIYTYALNIAGQKIEPSTTPTANKIPVADAAGKIADGWIDAETTPTANKIPVADAAGKIADGWIDAKTTPTANKIPVADAAGKIDDGWIDAKTTPTANKIPVADAAGKIADGWIDAKTTPTANKIPVAYAAGKIDDGWIDAKTTPTANKIPIADAAGKIDDGWIDAKTTPTANKIPVADEAGKIADGWIKDASATVKGVVELATPEEVLAGTDNERVVTPAGFKAAFGEFYPDLASPAMTGSATLNGTTDNTVQLTDIVTTLGLEVGDVIRIQYSGYDKLHSVESITNNDLIVVNYEHAGNRGNGSLKLEDETAAVTITRIAKWFNAPLGLGQEWVDAGSRSPDVNYTNTTERTIAVKIQYRSTVVGSITTDFYVNGGVITSGTTVLEGETTMHGAILPSGATYRLQGIISGYATVYRWVELR